MNNEPLIFGIVGGSGAGKTVHRNRLIEEFPERLKFSVSATTREKGEGETEGKDYYFLSLEEFVRRENNNDFLETNPFVTGSRYGTLNSELIGAQQEGKILLLDIEILGAKKIYDQYPHQSQFVFLDVSDDGAITRLEGAGTRKREKIPQRIKNLQEQRMLNMEFGFITLTIDTTGMTIEKVYKSVRRHFKIFATGN